MTYALTELPVDEAETLDAYLYLLPQERLQKALRYHFYRDRRLCLLSYLLLEYMCWERGVDIHGLDFSRAENGKPYFSALPELHFNLSHCAAGVACAVAETPVGVDIQETVVMRQNLQSKLFSKQEQEQIAGAENPRDEMTRLWTVKEARCKYTGRGLADLLQNRDESFSGTIVSQKVSAEVWLSVCAQGTEKIKVLSASEIMRKWCEKAKKTKKMY